jgi:hypothetical protein
VVLGTLGRIGFVVGLAGLLITKFKRLPELLDELQFGMDNTYIVEQLLASVTGFCATTTACDTGHGLRACRASGNCPRAFPHAAITQVCARHLPLPCPRPIRQTERKNALRICPASADLTSSQKTRRRSSILAQLRERQCSRDSHSLPLA